MFAPEVVAEKVAGFTKEFGWSPREHTIEEVDLWSKRLSEVFEVKPNGDIEQLRSLTKAEERFIANERGMCAASCYYFLTRYYYIKFKNKIARFQFRQGQWILWQMLCELDRKGVSKMLQILKARQLGISTLAEGIATWASQFVPGVAAQIGSADGQKTQIMLGMMTLAIDQLPVWLPPTQTRSKTASDRGMIEFSRIGSLIMVQPGSIRGGMGQGTTPTFVHLSEVSQYTDPVTQLDEGLFKALHEGPELVVLLESTGDASHKSSWWWKQQWLANRDNYWSGGADFLPVFLPWHTTPELYPGPWLKKHPFPEDFQADEDTIAHVRRAEAYVRSTPMLSKIMGEDWTMPVEQQWFWQYKHQDHKRRRVEKSWYRQMPCDDYEALLGERDKIVGDETIEAMEKSQVPLERVDAYSLVGDGVPAKHEPRESDVWYGDDSPARIKTHFITKIRAERLDWMFVPMKRVSKFDPLEKCLIFKEPQEGFDYSIGWDCGTGVGGDRSDLCVTRHGVDAEPDEQVAEFASDSVSLDDIYVYCSALTSYYSKHMHLIGKPGPKIAIEMRRKFGDGPYHIMRQMGFRRWHEWGQGFDRKTFTDRVGKHGRIGWFTNEWSRPLLLSRFFGAVENGWYIVRSKWLAEEISDMEQKVTESGKTRADHAKGEHDDRVFGAAMSYFTLHQNDIMVERLKLRYESPQDGGIFVEMGPCRQTIEIPGKAWLNSKLQIDAARRGTLSM